MTDERLTPQNVRAILALAKSNVVGLDAKRLLVAVCDDWLRLKVREDAVVEQTLATARERLTDAADADGGIGLIAALELLESDNAAMCIIPPPWRDAMVECVRKVARAGMLAEFAKEMRNQATVEVYFDGNQFRADVAAALAKLEVPL